jgi:hypothetical protein
MKPVNVVNLTLEPAAFAAIYELLFHMRLGNRNQWEAAIARTMIAWEEQGVYGLLEQLEDELGSPELSVTSSDSDGIVFDLN